ncbi:hypothetical protein GGI03_000747 [Coemansia sp. RSA 2337]|nr:hypothetical protein H4S03_006453 [Coemansia sp. S3946]KAJ2050375.1 hypothetical protein H4S04_002632 [Coemansia sp. S16]KAJ2066031.1 hypothetical protein GGH13_005876 [Coemansia sp. S155-1]KAJ2068879.1 hypothetical protein GGI08_000644 [Coemansia sp. S2]KAJ2346641.1 hypothetical protein GGH92_003510 [Coemansia sp. RSA 2673]KAJ2426926.1 hypothetical protein GGF41_001873 [Coemansia sp. RSA 2531]KAJ2468830.1 hypothetical protein GGI03_000747 [Coemansia sp. RSA 2337]
MSTSTTTMTLEQCIYKVLELLENSGKKEHISGKMTQLDHALHVANLAMREGADEETILAGLLIDISQHDKKQAVQLPTDQVSSFIPVDRYEADDFIVRKLGFSNKTCELVESNIKAKRYLSATDPEYNGYGEGAAIMFVTFRNNPLSPSDMRNFEMDPLFQQKVQLTKWDDAAAKVTGVKPPALDTYRDMVIRNLLMSKKTLY